VSRTLIFLFLLTACGVKGKPLAPLNPAPLGRGEPNYAEATQDLNIKKKKHKKIPGDWDEPKDFDDEGDK
jgi:hypothetical protein